MTKLKVKEWIIDKAQETASRYNVYINFERNENGMVLIEDGYMTVFVEEEIKETEKAIQVRLASGDVVGSVNGWKLWIPKSQIA